MFEWIAFDADDTLWHNEALYQEGRERFEAVLNQYAFEDDLHQALNEIEIHNLRYYGYGAMSFVLSLIETAIQVTGGEIEARDIQALLDLGKDMLTAEVTLVEGVQDLLADLSQDYPLMLITKGDLQHQLRKVEASGLEDYFRVVEVVSEKHAGVYRDILARHQISPESILMIGNSLRSDIRPVLELGGRAIHVCNDLSWAHEETDIPEALQPNYREVHHLADVKDILVRWQSA